jgi:hypothetical protein
MTIKADDINGRHQSFAEMVQGKPISPPGRTAAFDGLCCELRGLGLEVTLGQVVDENDPLTEKICSQAGKTLEEHFGVSVVDQFVSEGKQVLEIPAGDYVPAIPAPVPVIMSITNGRNGVKPKMEVSQEPLIDDIDVSEEGAELINAFIEEEVKELLAEDQEGPPAEFLEMVDFPSLSELEKLAQHLVATGEGAHGEKIPVVTSDETK